MGVSARIRSVVSPPFATNRVPRSLRTTLEEVLFGVGSSSSSGAPLTATKKADIIRAGLRPACHPVMARNRLQKLPTMASSPRVLRACRTERAASVQVRHTIKSQPFCKQIV